MKNVRTYFVSLEFLDGKKDYVYFTSAKLGLDLFREAEQVCRERRTLQDGVFNILAFNEIPSE